MNQSFLLKLHAAKWFCIGIFCLGLPLFDKTDQFGTLFSVGFGLISLTIALYKFRALEKIVEKERNVTPDPNAFAKQQAQDFQKYRKFFLRIGIFAFPLLTYFIVEDLNKLESGTAKEVFVWEPVAWLYNSFGYWPAVLAIPALGVVCTIAYLWLIPLIQKRAANKNPALRSLIR